MDREDRIRRFTQMRENEEKSANRVQDILEQKKLEKKKRDKRKELTKTIMHQSGKGLLTAAAVILCVVLASQILKSVRGGVQMPSQPHGAAGIQIPENTKPQMPEETAAENEKKEDTEGTAAVENPPVTDAWINMNSDRENVFYGNTVISTAGGLSLDIAALAMPDWVNVRFLTVNPFSRPCVAMNSIQYIAIHYVGNAGTTAAQNWSYFEGLKDTQVTKASSHFIVGLEGEVISCIPLNEMSYCTNERNVDTISIEVCHPDWDGQFNSATYQSVVNLTAWLCKTFALPVDHVIRHYDVTGKHCPKYYVENPPAWDQLRADVQAALDQM